MSGLIVPHKGFVPKVARSAFIAASAILFATSQYSPNSSASNVHLMCCFGMTSTWPNVRGLMSRNAKNFSSSYTVKEGICLSSILQNMHSSISSLYT